MGIDVQQLITQLSKQDCNMNCKIQDIKETQNRAVKRAFGHRQESALAGCASLAQQPEAPEINK